ncbi:MAG: 3,4-dihydroxy-2-butanone-4-phosphate synthase [Phycisphaeraceae bacterium]|nr:3,4-dihydroxy-2-butanone-4-phosphate synthase [Phycisphaeraceae bacterium]
MPFSSIPEILDELRQGRMVVLTDDEHRENEGDLVLPAQWATPAAITFMLREAKGYLCVSMTEADCDRLNLAPQAAVNTSKRGTAFTVSIDGHPRHGFTTGVSAHERARCIQMMIDHTHSADDFVRPGHVNPLRARDGGVLVRTGQTEGSVDLCRLAGLYPAALIIEIMRDDGEMARVPDLEVFCRQHRLKMCSVAQIIEHRLRGESLVQRTPPAAGRPLRTRYGTFRAITFRSMVDPLPHLVLAAGDVGTLTPDGAPTVLDTPTLVRMHRRHLLGDVFGDLDASADGPTCDILHESMRMITARGQGAIVYLRTAGNAARDESETEADLEGRLQTLHVGQHTPGDDDPNLTSPGGIGASAMPMAQREFGIGVQILRALGIRRAQLITNQKHDLPNLDAFGVQIVGRVSPGHGEATAT